MAIVVKDDNGVPIPQVQDSATGNYIPWQGINGAGRTRQENGANVALGSTTDPKAADGTVTASVIALLKAIVDKPSGGGSGSGTDLTQVLSELAEIKGYLDSVSRYDAIISNIEWPGSNPMREVVVLTDDNPIVPFDSDHVFGVRIIIAPAFLESGHTVKVAIRQEIQIEPKFKITLIETAALVANQNIELIMYPGASEIPNKSRNGKLDQYDYTIEVLETGGTGSIVNLYIEEYVMPLFI